MSAQTARASEQRQGITAASRARQIRSTHIDRARARSAQAHLPALDEGDNSRLRSAQRGK